MAEKVLDLPALGDRRPSQLLAAMLEFCPAGEADTAFFRASFFRRLPKEIRVLLADEVNGNLKELAIRADELYTPPLHSGGRHSPGRYVGGHRQPGGGCRRPQHQRRPRQFRPKRQEKPGNNAAAGGGTSSGGGGGGNGGSGGKNYFICNRHWKYGEKAYKCDLPKKCQWQGN